MKQTLGRHDELTFWEHLEELRYRLFRMLIYWLVGSMLGWVFKAPLLAWLRWPAEAGAAGAQIHDLPFRIFDPVGGLMLAMTVAAVAGLVLAGPFLLWELWQFLRPALERREVRWILIMIPGATALFLAGVAFCYWISAFFFTYLFQLNQELGVEAELTLTSYLPFMMKMLVVTGLSFELPILLMFLGFVGLITSRWLAQVWRQAIVAILILAAVITPTTDPLTMTLFSAPLFLLYLLSIGLVRLVEKRKRRDEDEGAEETLPPLPAEGDDPLSFYRGLVEPSAAPVEREDTPPE
ncbi:MAG TPA: twin-arginine translocase subunit TatC [Armatimonadota bacterium]|jgi:sec-independent protein translocase protein TatC